MRRITAKYAKPGMTLGMPIYDNGGNLLLTRNTKLEDRHLNVMAQSGVTEIFITDWRLDDIIIASMFPPELEGALINTYRQLITENNGNQTINANNLHDVHVCISKMAENMTLNLLGEINISGCVSEKDFFYIQPVKAAELAMGIGHKLNMRTNDLITVGVATLLKDVGFIQMPNQAANTSESTEALQKKREHPTIGYRLLKQHGITEAVIADAVLQHHECWNGSGFPRALKGEQISNYAQIVSLADTFSDLISARPGRGRYMSHEAIEYIMAFSGDQFNPKLVEFAVRQFPTYLNGLTVLLNSGEIGFIVDPNLGFIARPVVRVCYEPEKGYLKKPYDLDLKKSEFQRKLITKVLEYD